MTNIFTPSINMPLWDFCDQGKSEASPCLNNLGRKKMDHDFVSAYLLDGHLSTVEDAPYVDPRCCNHVVDCDVREPCTAADVRAAFERIHQYKSCRLTQVGVIKSFTQRTLGSPDAFDACETFCSKNTECAACSVYVEKYSVGTINPQLRERCKWNAISECGGVVPFDSQTLYDAVGNYSSLLTNDDGDAIFGYSLKISDECVIEPSDEGDFCGYVLETGDGIMVLGVAAAGIFLVQLIARILRSTGICSAKLEDRKEFRRQRSLVYRREGVSNEKVLFFYDSLKNCWSFTEDVYQFERNPDTHKISALRFDSTAKLITRTRSGPSTAGNPEQLSSKGGWQSAQSKKLKGLQLNFSAVDGCKKVPRFESVPDRIKVEFNCDPKGNITSTQKAHQTRFKKFMGVYKYQSSLDGNGEQKRSASIQPLVEILVFFSLVDLTTDVLYVVSEPFADYYLQGLAIFFACLPFICLIFYFGVKCYRLVTLENLKWRLQTASTPFDYTAGLHIYTLGISWILSAVASVVIAMLLFLPLPIEAVWPVLRLGMRNGVHRASICGKGLFGGLASVALKFFCGGIETSARSTESCCGWSTIFGVQIHGRRGGWNKIAAAWVQDSIVYLIGVIVIYCVTISIFLAFGSVFSAVSLAVMLLSLVTNIAWSFVLPLMWSFLVMTRTFAIFPAAWLYVQDSCDTFVENMREPAPEGMFKWTEKRKIAKRSGMDRAVFTTFFPTRDPETDFEPAFDELGIYYGLAGTLIFEFVAESVPQIAIQYLNNQRLRGPIRNWSAFTIVSISVSCFVAVDSMYRFFLKLCLCNGYIKDDDGNRLKDSKGNYEKKRSFGSPTLFYNDVDDYDPPERFEIRNTAIIALREKRKKELKHLADAKIRTEAANKRVLKLKG